MNHALVTAAATNPDAAKSISSFGCCIDLLALLDINSLGVFCWIQSDILPLGLSDTG
jgi:hypothetical protein